MIGGVAAGRGDRACRCLTGGRYVGTDDSYVHANKLMVSTDVSGLVQDVNVQEGQQVKKGAGAVHASIPSRSRSRWTMPRRRWRRRCRMSNPPARPISAAIGPDRGPAGAGQSRPAAPMTAISRWPKQNAIAPTQVDQARGTLQSAQATLVSLQQNAAAQLAKLNGNPNLPADADARLSEGQGRGGRSAAPARPRRGARAVRRHRQRSGFAAARHAGDLGDVGLHHHQRGRPDRPAISGSKPT